jgi:7-cyano-7-deazaguanine synthase in queuosine biosynthesis
MFDVPLINNKKYAVMLSGGLDSSTLCCLLVENIQQKKLDIELQPFSIPKKDESHLRVKRILDFVNERYGVRLADPILVGDPTLYHAEIGRSAVIDIHENYPQYHAIIFGSNRVPDIRFNDRDGPRRYPQETEYIRQPFLTMLKPEILDLVESHGLQKLYELSHSCTDLTNTRCNRCWQCGERAWAFKERGLVDTGTQ